MRLTIAFVTLAVILPSSAHASDEVTLIQAALWAITNPAGGSGRPRDGRPLVAQQTIPPGPGLSRFFQSVVETELTGTTKAAETVVAFHTANQSALSLERIPLRAGSETILAQWHTAQDVLAANPSREGLIFVSRPAFGPDGETAFVGLVTVERRCAAAYVYTFKRRQNDSWQLNRSSAKIVRDYH